MLTFRFAFPHVFALQGITYPLKGKCGHCGQTMPLNAWDVDELKRVQPGWYLDLKNREPCPLTLLKHKPRNVVEDGYIGD